MTKLQLVVLITNTKICSVRHTHHHRSRIFCPTEVNWIICGGVMAKKPVEKYAVWADNSHAPKTD